MEIELLLALAVAREVEVEPRGQDPLGVEARVDLAEPPERPQHQARAGEKHEGDRDLGDDQKVAHLQATGSRRGRIPAVLQSRDEAPPRRERGDQPEADAREQRDRQREEEDRARHHDLRGARREPRREQDEKLPPGHGDAEAQRSADDRDDDAFRQKLAGEPPPPRSERRAQRHLPLAAHETGQREVRDVGAGDEQDEADRGGEQQERRAGVPRELLAEGNGHDRHAGRDGIVLGVVVRHFGRDFREILARALERRPLLEAGEREEHPGVPVVLDLFARAEGAGGDRHVDVVLVGIARNRRQDPDDRVRPVVHAEDLADDLRIAAEASHPVLVREHEHRFGAVPVLALQEGPPEDGLHAHEIEEVRRDDAGLRRARARVDREGRTTWCGTRRSRRNCG